MARIAPDRSPANCAARPLISSATVPCPMEKTWNPPESVMIGLSQRWKRCSPPSWAISSWPGVRNRWNVFPRTMSKPSSAASRASSVLTTAFVASGTKAGVRTSPWASFSVPVRARASRLRISKLTGAESLDGASAPGALVTARLLGGASLEGLGLRAGDLDPARLALLGLGDADLEHAAVEARGHRPGVHALGQRQRPLERAGRPLHAVVALALGLVLGLALTGDGQRRVLELDLHVLLGHSGQVGTQHEMVTRLEQVHGRHPAPKRRAVAAGPVEDGVEQPVHLRLERVELAKRLPANDRHGFLPDRRTSLRRAV